jgi:hypothetical protein
VGDGWRQSDDSENVGNLVTSLVAHSMSIHSVSIQYDLIENLF